MTFIFGMWYLTSIIINLFCKQCFLLSSPGGAVGLKMCSLGDVLVHISQDHLSIFNFFLNDPWYVGYKYNTIPVPSMGVQVEIKSFFLRGVRKIYLNYIFLTSKVQLIKQNLIALIISKWLINYESFISYWFSCMDPPHEEVNVSFSLKINLQLNTMVIAKKKMHIARTVLIAKTGASRGQHWKFTTIRSALD